MGFEAYQIQRASDGKTLYNRFKNTSGLSLLPLNLTADSSWGNLTNATLNQYFAITVDYTRNFKQEYTGISYVIDQLPQNGEIYRLNPIFVNLD